MQRYRGLIASDLDGTLVGSDKRISRENREAIRQMQEAGVVFAACTGRCIHEARVLLDAEGIRCPVVTDNGARVVDEDDRVLALRTFPAEVLDAVLEAAEGCGLPWYAVHADGVEGNLPEGHWMRLLCEEKGVPYVDRAEGADLGAPLHCVINEVGDGVREALWAQFNALEGVEVTRASDRLIEILPLGANKGSGMASLAACLGVDTDRVLAMGDQMNDMAMLRVAGTAAVVGNGAADARDIADMLGPDCDAHGGAALMRAWYARHFSEEGSGEVQKTKLLALADQETNSIRVYDLASGRCEAGSEAATYTFPWRNFVQDIRLRRTEDGRQVALAPCSGRRAGMVDMERGELVWQTDLAAEHPHAAELLPGGILVFAGAGGEVNFFDLHREENDVPCGSYALESAHGLVYDTHRDRLWVLGYSQLQRLRVTRTDAGVDAVCEAVYPLPWGISGHDLWPVAGTDGRYLWLTHHEGLFCFDTAECVFFRNYPGQAVLSHGNIKAVASYADGTVVTLTPDGGFYSWTGAVLEILRPGAAAAEKLPIPGRASYKARVWSTEYTD